MDYKFLKHTADIKFRSYGKTMDRAFSNAVIAMFKSMYTGKVEEKISKKIKVKGDDLESLLYNFLEKLLILIDTKNFFVSKCKVKINQKNMSLEAELFGDNLKNYDISLQVKAITYNEMFIKTLDKRWVCQVVLDV